MQIHWPMPAIYRMTNITEYGKQAGSEDKQVLRPESLELHFTAHTFIYFKISHKLLLFLIF